MAEIKFTLPTVQYGNVKMTASPEELGLKDIADASAVGYAAAVYLNYFLQGFQKGASLDLAEDWDASGKPVKAPQSYWDATQAEYAKELLDEGLGGVTELPSEADIQAAMSVIGSDAPDDVQNAAYALIDAAEDYKNNSDKAPWDKDADPHAPGGSQHYDPEPIAPWEKGMASGPAAKKPWEESGGSPAAEW